MEKFKRIAQLIKRSIPNSKKVYLEHMGHLPLIEKPSECASIIIDHLLKVSEQEK